jgi:hypothetical protein
LKSRKELITMPKAKYFLVGWRDGYSLQRAATAQEAIRATEALVESQDLICQGVITATEVRNWFERSPDGEYLVSLYTGEVVEPWDLRHIFGLLWKFCRDLRKPFVLFD